MAIHRVFIVAANVIIAIMDNPVNSKQPIAAAKALILFYYQDCIISEIHLRNSQSGGGLLDVRSIHPDKGAENRTDCNCVNRMNVDTDFYQPFKAFN